MLKSWLEKLASKVTDSFVKASSRSTEADLSLGRIVVPGIARFPLHVGLVEGLLDGVA